MKKAIVFGATGFIGSHLLRDLLDGADYAQVIAVVRKPLTLRHPKLTVLIGDIASRPALKSQLVADEIFIALGTTRKHTPDEAEYYKIDHDYPVLAAEIASATKTGRGSGCSSRHGARSIRCCWGRPIGIVGSPARRSRAPWPMPRGIKRRRCGTITGMAALLRT